MTNDEHFNRILTINSGSSSVKFALFHVGRTETLVFSGRMDRIGLGVGVFQVRRADGAALTERPLESPDHDSAFRAILAWLRDEAAAQGLDSVGHRVVHGGTKYVQFQLIAPELTVVPAPRKTPGYRAP